MKLKQAAGFSLIELGIVVVIVGFLASMAIVSFVGAFNQAAESEARANVDMIMAAEKIYFMNTGEYVAAASVAQVNSVLNMNLSTHEKRKWDYTTTVSGTPKQVCVTASRRNGSGCVLKLCSGDATAKTAKTGCP